MHVASWGEAVAFSGAAPRRKKSGGRPFAVLFQFHESLGDGTRSAASSDTFHRLQIVDDGGLLIVFVVIITSIGYHRQNQ